MEGEADALLFEKAGKASSEPGDVGVEHSDVDLDLHLKESPLLIIPLDVTLKFRTRWKSPGSPTGTDKEWAMLDRGVEEANCDPLSEWGKCAEWRLALSERDRLCDLFDACVVLR